MSSVNSEIDSLRPSILCVHGSASAAWVWQFWRGELGRLGWEVNVLDLRGHGQSMPIDFATVTMDDYLWDIESVMTQIAAARGRAPVLAGWSMGGMLSLMYAARHDDVPALLLVESSPPLEVSGRPDPEVVRRFSGPVIGPESLGIFPGDAEKSRPALFDLNDEEAEQMRSHSAGAEESGLAFRQNLRGISIAVGSIQCPSLVLYGDAAQRSESAALNRKTALYLGAESIAMPGAGHWGVVMSQSAVSAAAPRVDAWLRRVLKLPESA